MRVSRGNIDSHIAARGRVEGATSQDIKLASRVVGRLKEVSVNDGDPIRKGQVVAVLENNDLLAQVEQARANVLHAQAALERLQNGARPEERAASRAAMNEAQAAADNARQNYAALAKALPGRRHYFAIGSGPGGARREDGAGAAGIGAAELQAGDGAARARRMWPPPRRNLNLARAQLAQAQDNYDNTFVRSPVDGVVVKRYMNPGESISYESLYQPIVSVSDTTHLMVRAEIDETDIGKIQIGQRASIRCDAFRGQTFTGTWCALAAAWARRRFRPTIPRKRSIWTFWKAFVEVDPGTPLRVGLRVDVYIELARKDDVLVIPLRAVEFQEGVATVNVRTPGGVEVRKVQLGAQDGLNIEVAEGLHEGEELVF